MNWLNRLYEKVMTELTNEEMWMSIGMGILKIILILIIAGIVIRIGRLAIQNIFRVRNSSPLRVSERRTATLIKLLENVLRYVVYFVVIVMILESLSIEIRALLAGAGIVGLAIGFGAQNLVRDIITGFFIIFEDQFSVGDFIRTGTFEGTVEEIGLRTTKIKSFTGEVHILPNGSIIEVTNFSINNSVAVVDISISYEGDIPKTEKILEELLQELPDKYEDMIKTPEVLGVQMLGASEVVLRIVSEVLPMRHFYISRILRKEVKLRLDQHGIEIPYPRMVMYTRDEGNTEKQNG
ncbi:small conductance mechanosensitive channel [Bacillus luteolus]|nr:small conductance mechanosensitive channel [Cytobacillus luteolus]